MTLTLRPKVLGQRIRENIALDWLFASVTALAIQQYNTIQVPHGSLFPKIVKVFEEVVSTLGIRFSEALCLAEANNPYQQT